MIIDVEVEVVISSSNFKYYKELGYIFKNNKDTILVKVDDLTFGSKSIVNIECDYCNQLLKSHYKNYLVNIKKNNKFACSKCGYKKNIELNLLKYGVEYTLNLEEVKKSRFKTNIEKYGSKSPFSSNIIKNKSKKTNIEKYGFENVFQNKEIIDKIKQTNFNNKRWSLDYNNYLIYRRRVKLLTNKVKMELLEEWNGYDYYDNEYIKENLNLHYNDRLYPTIDHKISVLNGFNNGLSPEFISNINNLCITKKYINSKKSNLNYNEFKTN
jgi:hypothetical protein